MNLKDFNYDELKSLYENITRIRNNSFYPKMDLIYGDQEAKLKSELRKRQLKIKSEEY